MVWQCELEDLDALADRIRSFLDGDEKSRSTSAAGSVTVPLNVEP